jgi:hypothetical protein
MLAAIPFSLLSLQMVVEGVEVLLVEMVVLVAVEEPLAQHLTLVERQQVVKEIMVVLLLVAVRQLQELVEVVEAHQLLVPMVRLSLAEMVEMVWLLR